jgi:hypothetical protein
MLLSELAAEGRETIHCTREHIARFLLSCREDWVVS